MLSFLVMIEPYYQNDLGKLYHGDCLEIMPELEQVDMIFTDPPYGHNNNNNGDLISRWEAALGKGKYKPEMNRPIANDGIEANEIFKSALKHFKNILNPGCCCCCCCGGGGGPDPQFARWSLWIDEVLSFVQMIVWDKGPMGMGWRYRRSYETILVSYKNNAPMKWYDKSKKIENIIRPTSFIKKIIPSKDHHPTIKTLALSDFFIKLHTQENDIVLDAFSGSGSTLLSCERLKRHWIGIEIEEKYCEISARRIEAERKQLKLFA